MNALVTDICVVMAVHDTNIENDSFESSWLKYLLHVGLNVFDLRTDKCADYLAVAFFTIKK